jgi:hypothetical protein
MIHCFIFLFVKYETESNGTQSAGQTTQMKPIIMKRVGPKIVSVTAPRPLIVQVQSLTQNPSQAAAAEADSIADDEENSETPKGKNEKVKFMAVR